jgi:hypothetical protein
MWHQCAWILQDPKFRSPESPIVYSEEGWLFARLPITHCPFCGERIHHPKIRSTAPDHEMGKDGC